MVNEVGLGVTAAALILGRVSRTTGVREHPSGERTQTHVGGHQGRLLALADAAGADLADALELGLAASLRASVEELLDHT
jgi:hypothetical protein